MKRWSEASNHRYPSSSGCGFKALFPVVGLIAPAVLLLSIAAPVLSLAQSRPECNKCCQEMFSDEYYLDQCKLKCFRDAGHCNSLKASRGTTTRTEQRQQPAPTRREIVKPDAPPAATRPEAVAPQEAPPRRAERAARRPAPFVWPETLVLNPGREWEAAGQILVANGIPPQHPNHTAALKAIEAVLTDFARTNPGGGDLPTDQLERIIRQARQ